MGKITVACIDTGKKVTVSVDSKSYEIVANTKPEQDINWQAYLHIQRQLDDACQQQGISFWETLGNKEGWSSEL